MNKGQKVIAAITAAVTISLAGIGLTARSEGKVNHAYADPAHGWRVPTICYGHTKGVKRGHTASDAQCATWLKEDLDEAAEGVLRATGVPLTQGELDAYTDFVFNLGIGNFQKSTLLRLLKAGDRVGACNQLIRWDYANGIKLKGLTIRREAERKLCLSQL
jgi:lysozyme